jgi:toxin CptA
MSHKSEFGLLLIIKPSKRLKKAIICVYLLALGAAMANALDVVVKISLCAMICAHGGLTARRLNAENHAIRHSEALGWEILEGRDFVPIEILKSTVMTTFALFLHFKHGSQASSWMPVRKKTWLVLNDALAENDYRRLIVELKTTALK